MTAKSVAFMEPIAPKEPDFNINLEDGAPATEGVHYSYTPGEDPYPGKVSILNAGNNLVISNKDKNVPANDTIELVNVPSVTGITLKDVNIAVANTGSSSPKIVCPIYISDNQIDTALRSLAINIEGENKISLANNS